MKYEYKASLVRIIDGDTYELEVDLGFKISFREKVRLYGADTPEVFGKNASQEGRDASAFVKKLLEAQPDTFTVNTHKDRKGKYGRYLADILLVNDEDGTPLEVSVFLSTYLIQKRVATPL